MAKAGSTEKVVREIRRHTRRRFSAEEKGSPTGVQALGTLNEGRSVNPGDTDHESAIAPVTWSAQRRPERQPRRHKAIVCKTGPGVHAQRRPERQPRRHAARCGRPPAHLRALNEGRSVNPGDTGPGEPAHHHGERRSTKAGASTPATRPFAAACRPRWRALNEGRSVNPGDTTVCGCVPSTMASAQRRPERQPRRHTRFCPTRALVSGSLNEGRSVNPGDTQDQASAGAGCCPSLNEGRSVNPGDTWPSRVLVCGPCGAQRRPERQPRRHASHARTPQRAEVRSTKAGASTPATPL